MDDIGRVLDKLLEEHGILNETLSSDLTLRLQPFHSPHMSFHDAKEVFKRRYIAKVLARHYGNISQTAQLLKIDRRSLHRLIDSYAINLSSIRSDMFKPAYVRSLEIKDVLHKTINDYKQTISTDSYRSISNDIETISESLLIHIDEELLPLKDALDAFEKHFLSQAIEQDHDLKHVAQVIGLRYETLIRKLNALGIEH